MRLSAPTRRTFAISLLAIAAGIVLWLAPVDVGVTPDAAFYLVAAGAILLVLGNLFNRL